MVDHQQTSEGNQVSKSSKNPSAAAPLSPSSPQIVVNSKEPAMGRASEQPLPAPCTPGPTRDAWGSLTALSEKAKSRSQGQRILLYDNDHILGRLVKDPAFQFDSLNVSGKHCTIFRRKSEAGDGWHVYIKDSSSNGTFINSQRLRRDSPEMKIKDGDIISLVNAPDHENAFAFLYQEIRLNGQNVRTPQCNGLPPSTTLKRKALYDGEGIGEFTPGDNKRSKGLGIGGPDGPVSLDDVRRLQRSNEELRKQLEAHLVTIEKLRAEARAAAARHDSEIRDLRETLSATFLDQIQDLRNEIAKKEKELESSTTLCAQQQTQLEDRDRSLAAAIQSRKDADEVIKSQNLNILELKEQLEDERNQRRIEREKAEADLKAAVERVRTEASEELKRQSESCTQQLKEHQEMINKLQEADNENHSLIEALRAKLEDSRETLVKAERTSRTLELRLQDEEAALAIARKKIAEKEEELLCATKELQNEKSAKEEALTRLSSLEVEMETAIHDLSVEQQRLQGARERIVLRETQLRAFHSTAEEIAMLQQKQQEQLKAMMRVLEDGEDEVHLGSREQYTGNTQPQTKADFDTQTKKDENEATQHSAQSMDNVTVNNADEKEEAGDQGSQATASSATSEPTKMAIDESAGGDTQMDDDIGTCKDHAEDNEEKENKPSATEAGGYTQVLETQNNQRDLNETQVLSNVKDIGAHFISNEDGRECNRKLQTQSEEIKGSSESKQGERPTVSLDLNRGKGLQGGEADNKRPTNTMELMTSEVAGSWAYSTPASTHCDTTVWSESHTTRNEGSDRHLHEAQDYDASQVGDSASKAHPSKAGRLLENSQGSLSTRTTWHDKERRDLNVMLDIVAPEFSRMHGLHQVMETAPDSEDHTEEEEESDDETHESGNTTDSDPVSQSVSVSARY